MHGRILLGFLGKRWKATVLLLKPIYTAFSIYEFLLSGVKGVTLRTHTYSYLWHCGADLKGSSTTTAMNGGIVISWMNFVFHSAGKGTVGRWWCQYQRGVFRPLKALPSTFLRI